jgi:hypothetical protein
MVVVCVIVRVGESMALAAALPLMLGEGGHAGRDVHPMQGEHAGRLLVEDQDVRAEENNAPVTSAAGVQEDVRAEEITAREQAAVDMDGSMEESIVKVRNTCID